MERFLSAPGKLFLSGEYTVLWGGVARVAAVGPRLSAFVRRREDRRVRVALHQGLIEGTATRWGVSWDRPPPEEFIVAARSLDVALSVHGKDPLGFELAVAPSPLADAGQKLGLGGSARAAVLVTE